MIWQQLAPSAIAINFGPLTVHWYGLILVTAMLIGVWYSSKILIKQQIANRKQTEDLFFYLIIFSLIGARLGHVVFFNLPYYITNPAHIIRVWQGGLSIQGALLLGLITVIVWTRRHRVDIWRLTDILVPAVALGQAIGRWGNYFNQELFGKPTEGWWGIMIEPFYRVAGYKDYSLFHPTFLYESILNLGLFYLLFRLSARKLKVGLLTLIYLGSYSLIRFGMEFVRIDETPLLAGFRLPQLIALAVILIVLILYFKYYFRPLPKGRK